MSDRRRIRTTNVAAAITVLGLLGALASGEADIPVLLLILVMAAFGLTTAITGGYLALAAWLPGVLGGVVFLGAGVAIDGVSGLWSGLALAAALVWTGAGLQPLLRSGAGQVATPTAAADAVQPNTTSLVYRRSLTPTYRWVVIGMAICLVALFLPWRAPQSGVQQNWVPKGTVTTYKNSSGAVVGRHDGTWLSPDFQVQYAEGSNGFAEQGGLTLLIVGYLVSGFVGLRLRLPPMAARVLPLLGLALLTWNAFANLIYPGVSAGTMLYLAGTLLAAYGGARTSMPRRPLRSADSGR